VCKLTLNTWRDHLIVEYEIPKYDGDLAKPNVFVSVPEELAGEKANLIVPVREPGNEALVRQGAVPRSHAHARYGRQIADRVCRSVYLSQAALGIG
jgi:hypothetical protein